MPPKGREQRAAVAEQFARWLREAAARKHMRQVDIVNATRGEIGSGTVAKWWTGENTASPEAAITLARILGEDAIDVLRAAGHDAIADYAADLRRGDIGALIERELDAIEDDPWLHWLAEERKRGTVSGEEYQRMRADFLRRKEESIRLMRQDYEDARRRHGQNPGEPESGGNGSQAAL